MTEMDESRAPSFGAVISIQNQLLEWLRDQALPLWDRHGVDRRSGGYFETIAGPAPHLNFEVSGDERRGRVVARQIYAFDIGRQVGWRSNLSDPVGHGCDYLFSRLHLGEGLFHTSVDAASHRPRAPFNLYEQAFYLFALARLNVTLWGHYPIAETALRCLQRLRSDCGKSIGGFEESNPPSLPLKSNPHMHLLEAALAWVEVSDGLAQQPWIELARELVGLCLTHFKDSATGAIREYFDYQWHPMPGEDGRIVEPGHQFEWAWLLLQWVGLPYASAAERVASTEAAQQLVEIGERWGVDSVRGIAINEIWDDMTTKDGAAKLWPQTERVKAWCAMLEQAQTAAVAEFACQKIVSAAQGLAKYLRTDAPGLWYEACLANGDFPPGPSKASSFYHVVCAIDVLRKTVSEHLTSVLYSPRLNVSG
jgi:mannose/cellobiose epimerase-like protein (N-acyl-D-glucosamine 2-epimerase family)